MDDITEILRKGDHADSERLNQVFNQLHAELKALARGRIYSGPEQTMTATALVHEVYLKMVGQEKLDLQSRKHFFAYSGVVMRNILVDAARARSAEKRGGDQLMVTLGDEAMAETDEELLALNEAMEELQQVEPALMELVHLRFFAGLTVREIAELQECSERTVFRDLSGAKAFLNARLSM